MRVWAIANQKGGVGKTTTTLCLGRGLAARGARVLLLDLDPHASLSHAFAVPHDPPPAGTHDLFVVPSAALASLARTTEVPGLQLVAAQPALATLERRSANQPGLGLALGRALHTAHGQWDYVLLDCPPTLGLLMVNALAAADQLVAPTQTDPLALHGLSDMLRTADMVERSRRRPLPRRILPTLFDRRTRAGVQCLRLLRERHGPEVWPGAIPLDTRLRDAASLARGGAVGSRGLAAYADALDWLLATAPARREAA